MKKTYILLFIMLLSVSYEAFSQIRVNIKARNRSTGDTITLTNVTRSRGFLAVQTDTDQVTGKAVSILYTDLRNYTLIPDNIESIWQKKCLDTAAFICLAK